MKRQAALLTLMLFFLCQSPARAESWPASREALAAENLKASSDWWSATGKHKPAAEKFAELWVQRNYGEDAVILSAQRLPTEPPIIQFSKLLDGYAMLSLNAWALEVRAPSGDIDTPTIKVVSLETEYNLTRSESTLVGFLPLDETFQDLEEARAWLAEDPRFAAELKELRTIVPEGVIEIDLRAVLGRDAADIREAWPLGGDVYALLRQPYAGGDAYTYEIIVWDRARDAILSRTPVPADESQSVSATPGLVEGALELRFTSIGKTPEPAEIEGEYRWPVPTYDYRRVLVFPDGTVDISDLMDDWLAPMPGGGTAIHEGEDGSLYAVDLATGAEELLLQGYSEKESGRLGALALSQYVPFQDELPYEADGFQDAIRHFYVIRPLDAHRFVYGVNCWEWYAGFGVYDLETRTDHRVTALHKFFGVTENALFGAALRADINTYETSPLPASVQDQLDDAAEYMTSYDVNCGISPDGKLLAVTGLDGRYAEYDSFLAARGEAPRYGEAGTVRVTDLETGDLVATCDIYNPFAEEYTVAFTDDTHLMLFCRPADLGSAYLYLLQARAAPASTSEPPVAASTSEIVGGEE